MDLGVAVAARTHRSGVPRQHPETQTPRYKSNFETVIRGFHQVPEAVAQHGLLPQVGSAQPPCKTGGLHELHHVGGLKILESENFVISMFFLCIIKTYMCLYMYIHVCVCACVWVYTYTCTHTHIFLSGMYRPRYTSIHIYKI